MKIQLTFGILASVDAVTDGEENCDDVAIWEILAASDGIDDADFEAVAVRVRTGVGNFEKLAVRENVSVDETVKDSGFDLVTVFVGVVFVVGEVESALVPLAENGT